MPKLDLNPPLINACGILSYLDVLERMEKEGADFGGYLIKSLGPFSDDGKHGWEKEKKGNDNPTVVDGNVFLNSFALPTHSVESWIEEFEKCEIKKPLIGSVWGIKPEDYALIVGMVDRHVDAWELNVSCPNVERGEGESVMEAMVSKVREVVIPVRETTEKPLIVKLSPNETYVKMAEAVAEYVDYIACGNTLGPGLAIDIYSRRPILAGVYGGMSGPAIKPKMVKMVNDVYEVVKGEAGIIAYGGIEKWEDVVEYAIAGAEIFGIGTVLRGMDTERVVEFTGELCDGVGNYLRENEMKLEDLVGSLRK